MTYAPALASSVLSGSKRLCCVVSWFARISLMRTLHFTSKRTSWRHRSHQCQLPYHTCPKRAKQAALQWGTRLLCDWWAQLWSHFSTHFRQFETCSWRLTRLRRRNNSSSKRYNFVLIDFMQWRGINHWGNENWNSVLANSARLQSCILM